jgi:diguanylate cyclase (GGDEF)-like protein/PAS domain S-box-containing protein
MLISATALTEADLESAIVRYPLIVSPNTTVKAVITQMSGVRSACPSLKQTDTEINAIHIEARSSCVLIADENQLLGIFTERDVVRLRSQKKSLENLVIGEVMTHPVITLHQSAFTDLFFVANLLQQYHIRHLPLLNEQDQIVGLLTHESLQQLSRPIDLLQLRYASDVMTSKVICTVASTSMLDITSLMAKHQVSSVVLVEEQFHPVQNQLLQLPIGIVTERDIVQFQALELDFEYLNAQAVMSTPVFSVSPEDSLWTVQQIMQQYLVKRIVVTGNQGELLGIVTQTSILKVLSPLELTKLVGVLENQIFRLEAEKLDLLQNRNAELEQQVQERTTKLKLKAEREQLIATIATQICFSSNLWDILHITVEQVRSLLGCDRAAIWHFQGSSRPAIIAESMSNDCVGWLAKFVERLDCATDWTELYGHEQVRVVSDIYKTNLSDCQRGLLKTLQIRAEILVPIIHCDRFWGWLNVIETQEPRQWQAEETALLQQLSTQLAIAIQQATAYEQLQIELSQRRKTEAHLRQSEQRYASLAAAAPVGIFRTDIQGNCIYVNERWCKIVGLSSQQAMGTGWLKGLYPDDREKVLDLWYCVALEHRSFQLEYRFQQPDGTIVWVFGQGVAEFDLAGQMIGYVGTITDISDRKQAEEKLIYHALHDPLTSLPNRNFLMERLELAINKAKRIENFHFGVLFLDLDRFKIINDSLGHLAGDQLLTIIAQRLQSTIRTKDLASRLGGDEFVILLEDLASIQEAIAIAERILIKLQSPLFLNGSEVFLTASIGIVFPQQNYHQACDLLRDADIAMYQAKLQGKSCYQIFDIQMHTQALQRLNLENDLRQALKKQEFLVYYQPIFDINNQHLVGFEALVRWQHPTRSFVCPGDFIPLAEETGLIVTLDHWILYTACQQLATWQTQFSSKLSLKVSVNLSAQDLRKVSLIQDIKCILAETGLAGNCLTLEITESMLIDNITEVILVLEQLKQLGIQISIDDFGTGYSSLNYLHRLPADNLKIDRSFINQMSDDNRNYQVVKTIVALSNQLGLAVIAEGIETQQQLQWLQELECEFGQGYFFSQPLAAHEIETLFFQQSDRIAFSISHRD